MNTERIVDDTRITSFGRLVEAHARLSHLLNEELEEEVGVPLLWLGVLLHIARSPEGVRPVSELINATAFTSGGVTRLVDRMERAGLVERRRCPSDRRVQFVALTEAGEELLQRATEVHLRGIQEHLVDVLEPEELAQLETTLAKLAGTVEVCGAVQPA